MVINVYEILRQGLINRKLIGLEYGANEGEGSREVNFGQLITHAWLSKDEDGDPIIKMRLQDSSEAYAYVGEDIEVGD